MPETKMLVRSLFVILIIVGATFFVGGFYSRVPQAFAASDAKNAPKFTHRNADDWINSSPLNWDQLKGKVVLLDFWTFGCWNCYRSFPWLHELESKLSKKAFTAIGIHTPEFDHEKDRVAVAKNTKKFNLKHPVMIDNDHSYWRAIGNRYWPTFYLVDKKGKIRGVYIGETHSGDSNAVAIEQKITQLLNEPG